MSCKALLLVVLLIAGTDVFAQTKALYVSVNGDDLSAGNIVSPYKTIDRARMEARKFSGSGNVEILVRAGIYYLDSCLHLDANDSGKKGFKVRYRAYNHEKVVISGGRKVPANAWMKDKNGIWKADLKVANPGNIVFRQLWVNGKKATRARCGFDVVKATAGNKDNGGVIDYDAGTVNGTLLSNALHKEDIEIWTYWGWMANIIKITAVSGSHITTAVETPYLVGYAPSPDKPQKNFGVENAYEFIDEPGEWFYDKHTSYLYYYPVGDSNPNNSDIVFPMLENIIIANGVSNVEFDGFIFSHATWLYPDTYGYIAGQGSIYVQYVPGHGNVGHAVAAANVAFSNCSHITIRSNTFIHLGAEALCFQNACFNNTIDNNSFDDIAGTAVRIGNGRDYEFTNPDSATHNNIISNNVITGAANEYRSHCGIWLGYVNNNRVINNKLSNLPYTGISTGYPFSPANAPTLLGANTIANNEISNVVNTLRDGGAIYNTSANRWPSIIKNNRIHDIDVTRANDIAGIYLDDGSSNFRVSGNQGNLKQNGTFTNSADMKTVTFINNNLAEGIRQHMDRPDKIP